tara:strand:+ start:1092 stop:1562 length:471 start_codon:yes stop_codon:yes gene_type:complete
MKDISNTMIILRSARANFMKFIDGFDLNSLNHIPENFNNNIIWNFGHVIATQQLLTYGLSGLPTPMDQELIGQYRKGTKPESLITQSEVDQLVELSESLIVQFEQDYKKGKFEDYKTYTTSFGYELTSIEDAIEFNNLHEGMHIGTCIDIRRFLDK